MPPFINELETYVLSPSGLVTILISAYVLWLAYRAVRFLASPFFSSLSAINGPPSNSFIFGHFPDLFNGNAFKSLRKYSEQYGHIFVIKAIFGVRTLITTK